MDNPQSWDAPRKCAKSAWIFPHSETDQTDVREQFQLQLEVAFQAGLALFGFARAPGARAWRNVDCRVRRDRPGRSRCARRAWSSRRSLLAVSSSVTTVPTGNSQNHVRAGVPGTVGAFAVAAAIGFEFAIVAVAQQGVVVRDSLPGRCCRHGRRRRLKARRAAQIFRGGTRRSRSRRCRPSHRFWLRQRIPWFTSALQEYDTARSKFTRRF